MDLGVGEMGFILCGKHPLLMSRIQVSDTGPKDPLVCPEIIVLSLCLLNTFIINP